MRRAVIFVVSVLMLGVGVCGSQESDDDGTRIWIPLPEPSQIGYTIQTVGEAPTYVRPQFGGGYRIQSVGGTSPRIVPILEPVEKVEPAAQPPVPVRFLRYWNGTDEVVVVVPLTTSDD